VSTVDKVWMPFGIRDLSAGVRDLERFDGSAIGRLLVRLRLLVGRGVAMREEVPDVPCHHIVRAARAGQSAS